MITSNRETVKLAVAQAESDLNRARVAANRAGRMDIRQIQNLCMIAQSSAMIAYCLKEPK